MWITSFMNKNAKEKSGVCEGCVTSSGNGRVGVSTSENHLSLPMVAPSGIAFVPKKGENAVVANLDFGAVYLGNLSEHHPELLSGELKLYSENASITLKNDGRILISGKVYINGEEV